MKNTVALCILLFVISNSVCAIAGEDGRQQVDLPERMQQHMMANMRDHLATVNEILIDLADGRPEQAAEIAETRLGMSALTEHGASHMGKFMPQGMREAGMRMHRAASRFAIVAQEGDNTATTRALAEITSACVACHAGYRVR